MVEGLDWIFVSKVAERINRTPIKTTCKALLNVLREGNTFAPTPTSRYITKS
jgi:hypothetical protein